MYFLSLDTVTTRKYSLQTIHNTIQNLLDYSSLEKGYH